MKTKTIYSKSNWDDNIYAIEFAPHAYNKKEFSAILSLLAEEFGCKPPQSEKIGLEAIPELDTYRAELVNEGQNVVVTMDEFTCSISTPSEKMRDAIYQHLSSL